MPTPKRHLLNPHFLITKSIYCFIIHFTQELKSNNHSPTSPPQKALLSITLTLDFHLNNTHHHSPLSPKQSFLIHLYRSKKQTIINFEVESYPITYEKSEPHDTKINESLLFHNKLEEIIKSKKLNHLSFHLPSLSPLPPLLTFTIEKIIFIS